MQDEETLSALVRLLLLGGLLAHGYIEPADDIEILPVIVDGVEVATLNSWDFEFLNEYGGPTFSTLVEKYKLAELGKSLLAYDMLTFLRKL